MICNFVCAAPAVVFPGGTGGTGGTPLDSAWPCGTGRVGPVEPAPARLVLPVRKSSCAVPPVPPIGPTKIDKTACSTTGSTWSPRSATVLSQE